MFEALTCLFTIRTKYNEPLASVNGDSDDDRCDIVGCGAAEQPATGPLILINYEAVASLLSTLSFCSITTKPNLLLGAANACIDTHI